MKHQRNLTTGASLIARPSAPALMAAHTKPVEPSYRGFSRVRAETPDIARTIEELNRTFATFREQNDRRLAEIEARGAPDTITAEQTARLNAAISDLQAEVTAQAERMASLSLNGGNVSAQDREHMAAFASYFRRGDATALRELVARNELSGLSNPDGGWLVPDQVSTVIDRVLAQVSAMRGLATVLPVNSRTYTKYVNQGGASANWIGEKTARTETDTPTLSELVFNVRTINAYPTTTQDLLDDAIVDIAAWLASEVDITFAEQEGDAFINGDGVNKPRGFLTYDTVANASYAWGKLGYLTSGTNGSIAADDITAMIYALRRGYRSNASWLLNDSSIRTVRQLKDSYGQYYWQPSMQAGEPAMLGGYPVEMDDHMPDVAANAYAVAFGDFRRGYMIVDRAGTVVIRDNVTQPGFVKFNTYKRVGGGVQNFEAIKLLKIKSGS